MCCLLNLSKSQCIGAHYFSPNIEESREKINEKVRVVKISFGSTRLVKAFYPLTHLICDFFITIHTHTFSNRFYLLVDSSVRMQILYMLPKYSIALVLYFIFGQSVYCCAVVDSILEPLLWKQIAFHLHLS